MLCPFKKITKEYDGHGTRKEIIKEEEFSECDGSKCMAFIANYTGPAHICKLMDIKENKNDA